MTVSVEKNLEGQSETPKAQELPRKNHRKRNLWMGAIALFFLILGIIWFTYWIMIGRFYVSTDNAYIHGNLVYLTPQVRGIVKAIYAEDTSLVEEGQLIVSLDPTDYEIALEQNLANLGQTVRQVASLFENVQEQEANIELRQAQLDLALVELNNREALIASYAISKEEYEIYQTNVATAAAQLELAIATYASALSLIEGTTVYTHPQVLAQRAAVKEAYINLQRCNIVSPVTGFISKRSVQLGQEVATGDQLLLIVPLYDLWAEANFKETQLRNIRIGQPVTLTTDIYGSGVEYYGTVVGYQAGTGDAFALLPAQNASGNWIKIIQRLPIRISLDKRALEEHPLMIGLSLYTHVDVHDTSGKVLTTVPVDGQPIYKTDVYNWDAALESIEKTINKIIEENISNERRPDSC